VPRRAEAVYRSVTLREIGEMPIARGELRSGALALPASGRYRASVELDGPENEALTLVVTSGGRHLVVLGGSVAEVSEWGRAGLIFQIDTPSTVHAEIFPSGSGPMPVSLRRVTVSKIEGITARPPAAHVVRGPTPALSDSGHDRRLPG